MLASPLTIGLLLQCALICIAEKKYDNYALLDIGVASEDALKYIQSLETGHEQISQFFSADSAGEPVKEVQIWSEGVRNGSVTVLVSPDAKEAFLRDMDAKRISHKLINPNVQKAIDEEKKPSVSRFFAATPDADFFSEFQPVDKIHVFMQSLEKQHPNIVQIEQIGKTVLGKPILLAKVGSNTSDSKKPGVWINGGIHAREWITISTVSYILHQIVTGYSDNAEIQHLVNGLNWYIVPVLNIDGYEYSRTTNRNWRQNRRQSDCPTCCEGVDLNRNFDFHFGKDDGSKNCSEIYPGPHAFSEPESQAVRDFLLKHTGEIKAFFDVHAFGSLWFYPFAAEKTYPEDIEELRAVSIGAIAAIRAVQGTEFTHASPPEIMYIATGATLDWAKVVAKVKYSFAIEVRGGSRTGFAAPTDQIVPIAEETWAGVKYVAKQVVVKET